MAKYKITNCGCDDMTTKEFEFTKEQVEFLTYVFDELNEESEYVCMPTIYIDEVINHEAT